MKRLIEKYLGELEDDDLILFSMEHLKDHKGPQKLVEGLEPVRRQTNDTDLIKTYMSILFLNCSGP